MKNQTNQLIKELKESTSRLIKLQQSAVIDVEQEIKKELSKDGRDPNEMMKDVKADLSNLFNNPSNEALKKFTEKWDKKSTN